MKMRRWKKIACAACLSACTALTYQAFAASSAVRPDESRAPRRAAPQTVLHGKGLVRLGGYELNVSFTPGGQLVCFDITAAPKSAAKARA
jgi:hypothetical protein